MLIPTTKNTKTITDLREKALQILNQLKKEGPTYIFHRSRPKAVMLSVEEYATLLETLEDYLDIITAKSLEERPEKGGISLEELARKYHL